MTSNSTIVRIIRVAARVGSVLAPSLSARLLERLFLTPSRRPLSPRKADWLATAEKEYVNFDGRRLLPLYTWGQGPTVLLVHGWSGRASQMRPLIDPLVERGFRVVAFDAPSHGESGRGMTGVPEMAAAIERVAERIGPVQAIVAHSLGTAAVTIALSRGLPVERAVYISPPENPGGYLEQAARSLHFKAEIAGRAQNLIEGRFSFRFADARGTLLAPGLEVPLLIIHDLNDPEVPHAEAVLLAQAWQGAELVTTEGLGHHRILRALQVQGAAIGFLCRPIPSPRTGSTVDDSPRPAVNMLKPGALPEGRWSQGGIFLGT